MCLGILVTEGITRSLEVLRSMPLVGRRDEQVIRAMEDLTFIRRLRSDDVQRQEVHTAIERLRDVAEDEDVRTAATRLLEIESGERPIESPLVDAREAPAFPDQF